MQDTPVKIKPKAICQGATYTLPLTRRYLSFPASVGGCGTVINTCTGEAVAPTDYIDEDYTGCTARMQIRPDIGSPIVIFEASTTDGTIALAGAVLTLKIAALETAAFDFEKAIGHIEITRPDSTVERQYEIAFKLSKEVTL